MKPLQTVWIRIICMMRKSIFFFYCDQKANGRSWDGNHSNWPLYLCYPALVCRRKWWKINVKIWKGAGNTLAVLPMTFNFLCERVEQRGEGGSWLWMRKVYASLKAHSMLAGALWVPHLSQAEAVRQPIRGMGWGFPRHFPEDWQFQRSSRQHGK